MPGVFPVREKRLVPDGITNAVRHIDYEHHEIHSGSHYRVQANNPSVGAGATVIIAFRVKPAQTKEPHFVFEWVNEGPATVQLHEGPTWTTNTGTRHSVKCSNRNCANNSIMQGDGTGAGGFVDGEVVVDPTGLAGGTVISDKREYAAARAGGSGGERRNEIVLVAGTQYALVITNNDTSARGLQIRTSWYEHSPGDY